MQLEKCSFLDYRSEILLKLDQTVLNIGTRGTEVIIGEVLYKEKLEKILHLNHETSGSLPF